MTVRSTQPEVGKDATIANRILRSSLLQKAFEELF